MIHVLQLVLHKWLTNRVAWQFPLKSSTFANTRWNTCIEKKIHYSSNYTSIGELKKRIIAWHKQNYIHFKTPDRKKLVARVIKYLNLLGKIPTVRISPKSNSGKNQNQKIFFTILHWFSYIFNSLVLYLKTLLISYRKENLKYL